MPFTGSVTAEQGLAGSLSGEQGLTGQLSGRAGLSGSLAQGSAATPYIGPVTVTPTLNTQVLSTAGLLVMQNITVNPIPSNYGLITWNGAVLTVS